MQAILQWTPILWMLRLTVLTVLGAGVSIFLLLAARFFRWTHIKSLLRAELPRVHSVGGEFAGTKATVRLVQEENNEQITVLRERVDNLQKTVEVVVAALTHAPRRDR
jgi:hypothetical protein